MKKFIKNIFIFIFILLLCCAAIQLLVSWHIKGKSIYGQDNFHIIKNQDNRLIFLGSSRCIRHFDPKFFQESLGISSVNLGVNGHSNLTMPMLRLKYYLHYNKTPQFAILNFDPISTYGSYNIDDNENLIEKNYYSRYAFLPADDDTMIFNYFHFNLAEKYIPLYALLRYRTIFDAINLKGGNDLLVYGYKKNTRHWNPARNPADTAHFFSTYTTFIRDKDSIINHLTYFNDYCKSNKIKLIIVQSPVFRSIYDKRSFNLMKTICHDLGILFIDTNEDSIINDASNFSDANHLNATGVPKMLNIVVKDTAFLNLIHHPAN